MMRKPFCGIVSVLLLPALLAVTAPGAQAHPMGNFAICHYTRLEAGRQEIRLRYILDMAEIPTVTEQEALDSNRNGTVEPGEETAYLSAKAPELQKGLKLTLGGRPAALKQAGGEAQLLPGAGGLKTLRLRLDFTAPAPAPGARCEVTYRDSNYEVRAGWKEIVAVGGRGIILRDSSVPAADRSRELTAYPPDAVPPQETTARFIVVPDGTLSPVASVATPIAGPGASGSAPGTPADDAPQARSGATPRDAFTETIASRNLSPGVMLLGLALAFLYGALHALSPGHGKAMVAAYLVGARGTAKHAVFLGLIVTVTHTLGVFALGLATLLASRYILPERLYPALGGLSGLMVSGVGLRLLLSRLRRSPEHAHHEGLSEDAAFDGYGHSHPPPVPDGPVTLRALLALGISGGLIPCPSALVVLLSAIALHRVAYGMLLITAFSVGLAAVLVAIGLLVVSARRGLERLPSGGLLAEKLPLASAALITLIGIALILRSMNGI